MVHLALVASVVKVLSEEDAEVGEETVDLVNIDGCRAAMDFLVRVTTRHLSPQLPAWAKPQIWDTVSRWH